MKYLIILFSFTLHGCPPEHLAQDACRKIVECSIDEESFCDPVNKCDLTCYHNFSEYCIERTVCPEEKK
jgi:hypothetical protein